MRARRRARALTAAVRRAPAPALILVSIVGWAAMVWLTAEGAAQTAGMHAGLVVDSVHAAHGADAGAETAASLLVPHGLAMWSAMVVAMSPLLLLREVARLWRGSLRRRRGLTILVFVCGYVSVWALAGALALPLGEFLSRSTWLGWPATVLVVVWHCSPARQRFLNACHRTPRLRVFGGAAQRDALRYGAVTGAACAASCGPIMLLVVLAANLHLVAMVGATILLTLERYLPARRPRWRLPLIRVVEPEHAGVRTDMRGLGPVVATRAEW
jgi:predicted metal-binding membrane protein